MKRFEHQPKKQFSNQISVDHRTYHFDIYQSVRQPDSAPRLVVVSYLPNLQSQIILRVCIQAIRKFTTVPYELWIVDNNSPRENLNWLLEWDDINVILNRTEPRYPKGRDLWKYLKAFLRGQRRHPYEASYANGIALELAARVISPDSRYMMTLHQDTMPCYSGWLKFLIAKIDQGFSAAGVRLDKIRTPEGILHILGNMLDFQRFQALKLDFLPILPLYDTGDLVTINLRQAGDSLYACRNTLWEPELADLIPERSPLRTFQVDRAFDDHDNVIFMHLARGVSKTMGTYQTGITPEKWIDFSYKYVINEDRF